MAYNYAQYVFAGINVFIAATVILVIAYIGIAFNRIPKLNVDRTSAAFICGILMIIAGVLTFPEAINAINFDTIALLLGTMILVAALKRAGFSHLIAVKSLSLAQTPVRFLILVIVVTSVACAFLVNDTWVLLFTPIVIHACRMRKLNPIPYLIGMAMASNIGSTATIIGNPQNMIIGITSGISFTRFFLYLAPVSIISTIVLILVTYFRYRNKLEQKTDVTAASIEKDYPYDARTVNLLIPVVILGIAALFLSSFLHIGIPLIALIWAIPALLLSKAKPTEIIRDVDLSLLVFFAGLFIVIEGAYKAGVLDILLNNVVFASNTTGIATMSAFSALGSQVVSNVPLTILAIPMIKNIQGDSLWISLAAGATLGGNLTIIGAVANIIVVEGASREGVKVGFIEFFKVGLFVAVISIALAILILMGEYNLGWLR